MRILFQGDSITDGGSYGKVGSEITGYAKYVIEMLGKDHEYFNRGVSGNRSVNILGRFYKDILEVKPDFMALLAGVNDVAYRYLQNIYTPPEMYYECMKDIILKTKLSIPGVKILVVEPFLFPVKEVEQWRKDLSLVIEMCRKVSREYADGFVPLDGIFAKALMTENLNDMTDDGIHPKEAAQKIMAKSVADEIKRMLKVN